MKFGIGGCKAPRILNLENRREINWFHDLTNSPPGKDLDPKAIPSVGEE